MFLLLLSDAENASLFHPAAVEPLSTARSNPDFELGAKLTAE